MKFNNKISTKNVGFHKINEIGLKKAYESNNKVHVDGDTAFIAGTSSWGDIYDDLTKIPFWGDLRNSTRYKQADEVLKQNPQVKKLVSHSLGGSVSLEIEKNYPDKNYETTTYGAPVFMGFGNGNRYRHRGDPFSMLDFNAKNVGFSINPWSAHSYENY